MQLKTLPDRQYKDWQEDLKLLYEKNILSKQLYAIPCKMVYSYRWAQNINDLKSAGIEGLLVGLVNFDSKNHKAFLSYIRKVIRGYIADEQRTTLKWESRVALGLEASDIDLKTQDENDPERLLIEEQLLNRIKQIIEEKLSIQQSSIICLAFGLGSGEQMNMADIARCLNLPYFGARQSYNEALAILKNQLNEFI